MIVQQIMDKLQSVSTQPIGLIFAFLLGAVSAVASTCCTLPALGLVAGYSGTKVESSKETTRRDLVKSTLFFMLGTVISLMIIGAVSGLVDISIDYYKRLSKKGFPNQVRKLSW